MATTVSNVNWSVVEEKVIPALRNVLPQLKSFSYAVESDQAKIQNDSIFVPVSTDPTVGDKTAGTAMTPSGALEGKQVTLSRFRGAPWAFKEGTISRKLCELAWADKIVGAVWGLGKDIVDTALALVTADNFGDEENASKLTVAIADYGQADLAKMWELAESRIKQRERSYGMNAAVAGAIFGESNIALAFANSGNNYIQTGVVPQLLGMNTWAYGAFPANSQNLASAVFGRAAILVGMAPPEPLMDAGEGDIIDQRVVRDPETGIACLVRIYGSGNGTKSGEVLMLSGVAVGQATAIVRHVTGA
jgi:hypothetical protein